MRLAIIISAVLGFGTAWVAEGTRTLQPQISIIVQTANQEPVGLRAYTLAELSEEVGLHDPARGAQLASEADQCAAQIKNADARAQTRLEIYRVLLPLSGADAERVAREIPRARLGDLYEAGLYTWLKRGNTQGAVETVQKANRAGIYTLRSLPTLLDRLASSNRAQAGRLAQGAIEHVPGSSGSMDDVFWLIDSARTIYPSQPLLAVRFAQKAVSVANDPLLEARSQQTITVLLRVNGRELATKSTRETVLVIGGAILHAAAPDLYARYRKEFQEWQQELALVQASNVSPFLTPQVTYSIKPGRSQAGKDNEVDSQLYAAWSQIASTEPTKGQAERLQNFAKRLHEACYAKAEDSACAPLYKNLDQLLARRQTPSALLGIRDASVKSRELIRELSMQLQETNRFSLRDLAGNEVRLENERGKVVLLDFWATWCPPCRAEMPQLEKLKRELSSRGLAVLTINSEDPAVCRRFIEHHPYRFPVLLDASGAVSRMYRVEDMLPVNIILSAEGRITERYLELPDERSLTEALERSGLRR